MSTPRTIRLATIADLPQIASVLAEARKTMRASGNMNQWTDGYPQREIIVSDIERRGGYVVVEDNAVVAYFAMLPSPEPSYATIDGAWIDDTMPYHVVHRIGALPTVHGIFNSVMDYCFSHDTNIRIDTHRDNHIMQHLIASNGFNYCGIVTLSNGTQRLAYQKINYQLVIEDL